MQVPDKWWNKFKEKEIKMRNRDPRREDIDHLRCALAMCENIDWNVGRILNKIDELEISKNTIVIFFHDNGPNGVRWNGGMKGRKGSTDEGGVRSPLLIRWPDHISRGIQINQIASAMDLLPTLADFAKIPIISKKRLDGKSLKPLLFEQQTPWKERTLINYWRGKVSARTQSYRLDNFGRLYDMNNDPGQQVDISKLSPKVTKKLLKEVEDWKKNVLSELGKDERSFIIGHPNYRWTQIPARDGTPKGAIKRSGRFPNCSYFSNWKNTKDICEFLVENITDDNKHLLKPVDKENNVSLHISCHSRAQNIGQKATELLRLIPQLKLDVIERCSGHGGSWGIKKNNFEMAIKVGKPVARKVIQFENEYVVSECPLAGTHIQQGVNKIDNSKNVKVLSHPLEILAKSMSIILKEKK